MKIIERFIRFMSLSSGNAGLMQEQYRAYSRQMPMMYLILVAGTWALALTHIALAPWWLTLLWPSFLTVVSIVRLGHWARKRDIVLDAVAATKALRKTYVAAVVITVAFAGWAFTLYPYGDAYARSHVAFYLAIIVIACIFCLMYVRPAAFTVAAMVNGAFIVFFMATGQPTFIAMAVTVAFASIGMMLVVHTNHRTFESMVLSQQRSESLSPENLRLANLDSLTDLPNRRSFFASLNEMVAADRGTQSKIVVGLLDLDGFKAVNDTYGHAVGDALLCQVALRLRENAGPEVGVFRLGGDEFALIFVAGDVGDVLEQAYDLCASLRQPYHLTGCTARISSTIGLAVYPDMAGGAEELFERADYAMYRAKRGAGRGEAWLFSAEDEATIRRSSIVEQALKVADLDDELSLMFQPIVDIQSGDTIGFEALARWESPELGRVSPAEFIPVAEQAGLINGLTVVLLDKALRAAETWPDHIRLSFNLSVFDISSAESLLRITSLIGRSGVSPSRIEFEITETAMVSDFAAILAAVDTLKRIGVSISLDDFGTGYSSLRQVHQLPLDKLKIDRSFVSDIDTNEASQKIVKSLVSLCNDLHLACVVEGVETRSELDAIRMLGGKLVQGYYYGTPARLEDLPELWSNASQPIRAISA